MGTITTWREERLPALSSPDYRRLFLNSFFASASHWTMLLARGWLIFEMTDSAAWVGAATFAGMIPFLVTGPVGGALADRFDRRALAMRANSIGISAALVLAALTLSDVVEPWQIVALAGMGGFGRSLGTPAEQAMIPNLVQREHLLNAVALQGISRHGSRLVGPLIGAVVLSTIGSGGVFVLSAGFLTLALHQLWLLRYRPDVETAATRSEPLRPLATLRMVGGDIREGLAYVRQDRRVMTVLVLVALHCGSTMAFDSMMPTLATTVGGASRTFSGIIVGIGAGAIVGTFGVAMMRDQALQGRTLAIAGLGSGLSMLVLGFAVNPAMAVAGGVLAGATQSSYMALSAALVQRVVPDELRGRVMAIYVMLAAGHMAFVNFGFGWLADAMDVRILLIVPGLLWVTFFSIALIGLPELRTIVRSGAFRALPEPAAVPIEA